VIADVPARTFTPFSVDAAVGDIVQIKSNGFGTQPNSSVFDFAPVESSGIFIPCLERSNSQIVFGGNLSSTDSRCSRRHYVATIEIKNTNPIAIFAAGHCTDGMIMSINLSDQDGRSQLRAKADRSRDETLSPSTFSSVCLNGQFISPETQTLVRNIALAVSLVLLVTLMGGLAAFLIRRRKRRQRFAAIYAQAPPPYPFQGYAPGYAPQGYPNYPPPQGYPGYAAQGLDGAAPMRYPGQDLENVPLSATKH